MVGAALTLSQDPASAGTARAEVRAALEAVPFRPEQAVVDALADSWGVLYESRWKAVWFEMRSEGAG